MNDYDNICFPFHLQPSTSTEGTVAADVRELQEEAARRQAEADAVWADLFRAHVAKGSSWAAVLHSALAAGVRDDELRKALAVPPSTFARWLSGIGWPGPALRGHLTREVVAAVEGARSRSTALVHS